MGSESWVFKWGRELNTNKFLDYMDLWQIILRYKVKVDSMDSWVWKGSIKKPVPYEGDV